METGVNLERVGVIGGTEAGKKGVWVGEMVSEL